MSAVVHQISAPSRWPLVVWSTRAWRRLGWRHVLLAWVLQFGRSVFGPLGGVFFFPTDPPAPAYEQFLDGSWLVGGLSIVFILMVADEAFDDGVSALRAYGLAVLVLALFVPVADWLASGHFGWMRRAAPTIPFWAQVLLFQGGMGVSIYAYGRVIQRTMLRTRAAETERVLNEHRIQSAKLLALQSRVEPQLLFDTLARVAQLHAQEPQAADALLADLIALLRAMQLGSNADNSTVEREFALGEAWLRVAHSAAPNHPCIHLQMAPDAARMGIAPMFVLPMLRAVLVDSPAAPRAADPSEAPDAWLLSARIDAQRLIVQLESVTAAQVPGLATSPELASMRKRLYALFGASASLSAATRPARLILELPCQREDVDDDRADR